MEKIDLAQRVNKHIYAQDGKCYKVFAKGYSKSDILQEAYNHTLVEHTSLHIPKFLGVSTIDEEWAIIMEYIDGKTLADLMNENPDHLDEYLELFVRLQIEAQNQYCPLLRKHNDKMNYKIEQTSLSATLRYNLHSRIEAMSKASQLCHGDFNPTNIVIKDGFFYILDWSHATQGDGKADAARTYLLFLIDHQEETAEKYLACYCKFTGNDPKDVKAWLPVLSATQSLKGHKEELPILNRFIYATEEEL